MTKTNEWMTQLITYSLTPEVRIEPFLKNKSQLNSSFPNIELTDHTELNVYDYYLNNLDQEAIKREYLRVYKRVAKQVIPNFITHYNFYRNRNLIRFITVEILNQESNSTEFINMFVVNYFPFTKGYVKTKYFLQDDNDFIKFKDYKLIKMDKLGYIVGIFKVNGVWQLVKFNDFADKRYDESNSCFIIAKMKAPTFERGNIIDDAIILDFNESYSNVDYYDLAIYTKYNTIWYGRSKFQLGKEATWEKAGFVAFNKQARQTQTEKFVNLNYLSVSSITQNINDQNKFFGNITLSVGNRSEEKVYAPATQKATNIIPIPIYQRTTGNSAAQRFLGPTSFSANIKQALNNEYFSTVNNKDNKDFVWTKRNFTFEFSTYPEGELVSGISGTIYKTKYGISFQIDSSLLQKLTSSLGSQDIRFELSLDKQHDYKRLNVIVNVYLFDELINTSHINVHTPGSFNSNVFLDFNFSFDTELKYQTPIKTNSPTECFKIVVYDYKDNPNKLLFQKDKVITNVENSAQPIAMDNNDLYMPVKKNGKWLLYLFDNGRYNINSENMLIQTNPVFISEIKATDDNVKLIRINNEDNTKPICVVLSSGNSIMFFYKNLASKDLNGNFYFSTTFLTNYTLELPYIISWREQNTVKILANKLGKWKVFNFTYNGSDFNLTNSPYIFKGLEQYKTVKELMTISTIESANKEINVNVENVSNYKNELVINYTIKASSCNAIINSKEQRSVNIKGANNNVIFSIDESFNKNPFQYLTSTLTVPFNVVNEDEKHKKQLSELIPAIFVDFNKNIQKLRNTHLRFKENNGDYKYVSSELWKIENNKLEIQYLFLMKSNNKNIILSDFAIGDKRWDDKNHIDYLERRTWWRKLEQWEPIVLDKPKAVLKKYALQWD